MKLLSFIFVTFILLFVISLYWSIVFQKNCLPAIRLYCDDTSNIFKCQIPRWNLTFSWILLLQCSLWEVLILSVTICFTVKIKIYLLLNHYTHTFSTYQDLLCILITMETIVINWCEDFSIGRCTVFFLNLAEAYICSLYRCKLLNVSLHFPIISVNFLILNFYIDFILHNLFYLLLLFSFLDFNLKQFMYFSISILKNRWQENLNISLNESNIFLKLKKNLCTKT